LKEVARAASEGEISKYVVFFDISGKKKSLSCLGAEKAHFY
jgi:hypothetical protein